MARSNADTIRLYYEKLGKAGEDFPAFEAFLRSMLAEDAIAEDFPFGNTAQVSSQHRAACLAAAGGAAGSYSCFCALSLPLAQWQ